MRFMLLVPGTGNFFCGSCLRDDVLGRALRARGHQVDVVPLYLPLKLEGVGAPRQVHMGGINMFLQQKTPLARRLPRWFANLLDSPRLLRWASKRARLTQAPGLGEMTVSMLKGEHGNQVLEVKKLVEWAAGEDRPDVVVLSNLMLAGVARPLKQALDRPVVATLQGEAPFLDALPEPFSDQAWGAIAERAADIDAFAPVSHSYSEVMSGRLGLDDARIRVVHNGIDLSDVGEEIESISSRKPRAIGYLARMCEDKGLHTLVDAFLTLREDAEFQDLQLRIAGAVLNEDREFVGQLQARIADAGCADQVEFHPNVDRAQKLAFLRSLSVFSVPATYGESFGLYVLEALAAGVPVVQPRHSSFPEILGATGGGILCEPDDPSSLAQGLKELLLDPQKSQDLADRGRMAVRERFTADRMAGEVENLCRMVCSKRQPAGTN